MDYKLKVDAAILENMKEDSAIALKLICLKKIK